jgi:hypothetical protein
MTNRHAVEIAAALGLVLAVAARAQAHEGPNRRPKFCTATARAMLQACQSEGYDDYAKSIAICINEGDPGDRASCGADARSARDEHAALCVDQFDARREICRSVGEGRYDPAFDEANFVTDFTNPRTANPYLPLAIGNTWDYAGPTETDHIEVLGDTKRIDDVTCLVVRDQVSHDGFVAEDTDDWFALAHDGDVWYCGEEVKEYEIFDGDQPQHPELVSLGGSFKVDRDGAKPGIFVLAAPVEGRVFRQEFALGTAEDVVEVLATDYVFGEDDELDELVPEALADYLCGAGGCFVTRDFTPIEPGSFERKYYAPGIGVFLETNPEAGTASQLVGCNFDPRCAALPTP